MASERTDHRRATHPDDVAAYTERDHRAAVARELRDFEAWVYTGAQLWDEAGNSARADAYRTVAARLRERAARWEATDGE